MKRMLLPFILMLVLLVGLLWLGMVQAQGTGLAVDSNVADKQAHVAASVQANNFEVNNSADDADAHDANPGDCVCADSFGACTLRAAIEEANQCPGADYITFENPMTVNISAGEGGLPSVQETLIISASNVWNTGDNVPGVTINGGGINYSGLYLGADGCQIYGLHITGFDGDGILVVSSNNWIGGGGAGQRNVLSGNDTGISLYTSAAKGNIVHNNYIGLTPAGNATSPNETGLYIGRGSSDNIIGGNDSSLANFISGNTNDGVRIEHENTDGNWLGGNLIGLSPDLSSNFGNGGYGIHISDSQTPTGPANTIIGGVSGSGNFIAYNGTSGIYVYQDGGGTQITYNIIGSNTGSGVYIRESAGVIVGNNLIGSNTINGVRVVGASAAGNLIWPNGIWNNGSKGIELQNGANFGIVAPTITSAYQNGASGTGACASCTVALYSDASDEGQIYHGVTVADLSGNWTYDGYLYGPNVTATAIDISGNTSEFSIPVQRKWRVFLPMVRRNP